MGRRALVLSLWLAACGSSSHPTSFGGTTGFAGVGGRAPPTSSGTTGGGANGNDSLSGPLGFTPQNGWATLQGTIPLTVALTDGYSTCSNDGAYQALLIDLSLPDGGAPQVGTYLIDVGAEIALDRGTPSSLPVYARAISGQVTVNQLDASQVGGNFAITLQPLDGGGPSDLAGIFVVPRCY